MATTANPGWAELVQLVPVVTLASSFLVHGEVDLTRAGPLFGVAAALTLPVHAAVWWKGHLVNPIALGAAAWLWTGALVFAAGWAPGVTWLADARAAPLFADALAVSVILAASSPTGCMGARSDDPAWVRRASAAMLVFTAAALAWSWTFRADLRVGNGLPFIALNLARRALVALAARRQ